MLNVGPNDEVITTANTFVATVGAINELGAKVVFVDCDDSFCRSRSRRSSQAVLRLSLIHI